jgi:hypothetical protein
LQLLRLAFWLLPWQRWTTGVGLALIVLGNLLPLEAAYAASTWGTLLILLPPALGGGLLLRAISAPRSLRLAPHGRARLLTAVLAMILIVALGWLAIMWVGSQRLPPKFALKAADFDWLLRGVVIGASYFVIGLFIASRSPVMMLVSLVLWLLPGPLLERLGVEDPARLWRGASGLVLLAAIWLVFGAWYLCARRIAVPGWLLPGSGSVLATTTAQPVQATSVDAALRSLLLGGGSVQRIAWQWLCALALLLGVQLVLGARSADPRLLLAVMLASLSISTPVIAAVAFSTSARSRSLWLTAGRRRGELFEFCEALVLQVSGALFLVVGLLFATLWFAFSPRPQLSLYYLVPALLVPGLAAGYLGLASLRRWRASDVLGAAVLLVSWYQGLLLPLLEGEVSPPWGILLLQVILVVVLRILAQQRWQHVDWHRAPSDAVRPR